MPAFKSTELLDAAIDAYGVGVSLRGISVATDMTEVKPISAAAKVTKISSRRCWRTALKISVRSITSFSSLSTKGTSLIS